MAASKLRRMANYAACRLRPAAAVCPPTGGRCSHPWGPTREAFGVAGHVLVTARVCGPHREGSARSTR